MHTYICTHTHTHTQGDNPRERALDMMMGGRLEANVEDDLFKARKLTLLHTRQSLVSWVCHRTFLDQTSC